MHTEATSLVTGCRYDTPFGIVSYRYRFATKLRLVTLLYSCEKLIHVHMDDLHKLILCLFRFDVNHSVIVADGLAPFVGKRHGQLLFQVI